MPVEFRLEPTGSSSDSTRLAMMYDGSGRRISKTFLTKSATAATWDTVKVTHYTGIGTEIREEFHNGTREKVNVVVNMPVFFRVTLTRLKPRSYIEKDILRLSNGGAILPKQSFGASRQGLGRYKVADASQPADDNASRTFEWYLKNHLGSTMLVFGTQSSASPDVADNGTLKAAYDYHAFGEQLTLVEPTDKVTENFTGKERDDETALNYFGARYLDPMLGLWTSVNPARQFASPYLYAGNGMNPVNVVDGDGNAACIQKIGNNVNVTIPVTFNGSASNRENINLVKKIVAQHFTGEFGKYNLKTSVVEYNEKIHNRNIIVTLEYNIISFLDKNQINPQHAYINMNSDRNILHEFAHLMGLDDKYYHDFMNIRGKNGLPYPGYESNLMGGVKEDPDQDWAPSELVPGQIEEMWGPGPIDPLNLYKFNDFTEPKK